MPRLLRERRQQQPGGHQGDARLHHQAWPGPVHQAADQRTEDGRNHEAEREGARRHAALPAELAEDGRKQQGKGGADVDADAHADEDDSNDQPTVKEGRRMEEVNLAAGPGKRG